MKELQNTLDTMFGRKARLVVAVVEQRRAERAAMARARRLAAKHDVTIERDGDGHWVTNALFDDGDDDPLQGSHFCVGGIEVEHAVRAYVDAIAAKGSAT